MSPPCGETLDLQEASDLLRIDQSSMKELVDKGEVPAVVLNEKHLVILREDLITYLREEGRRQTEDRRDPQIDLAGSKGMKSHGRGRMLDFGARTTFDRLLRINDVLAVISVSRASLYRMIEIGQFPRPVKIGTMSAWPVSEVVAYIDGRKRLRTQP